MAFNGGAEGLASRALVTPGTARGGRALSQVWMWKHLCLAAATLPLTRRTDTDRGGNEVNGNSLVLIQRGSFVCCQSVIYPVLYCLVVYIVPGSAVCE